jgi:hypothetical protein
MDVQQATWHPAMNKWRDQTGIAHVLEGDPATPICGGRAFSFGGGFSTAQAGGAFECRRCRRVLNSRARKAAPEPLDMLRQVERWMSGYGTATQSEMRERVRAALTKAEGRG